MGDAEDILKRLMFVSFFGQLAFKEVILVLESCICT